MNSPNGHHAIIDDSGLVSGSALEIVNRLGVPRRITHAIHDIDGTHSLIRDWPPVMSLAMWYAMTCGFPEDFDSEGNLGRLAERVGQPIEEFDDITRFFNGYSAITQLEYGIRRGIAENLIPPGRLAMTDADRQTNALVLERLREGDERHENIVERREVAGFIDAIAPRLFRFYETLLCRAGRDRNVEDARVHPDRWRVPGSIDFLSHLKDLGIKNYFVTGTVIHDHGGMREEVEVCGYDIGPGRLVESLQGSSWDRKMPKDEVMRDLFREQALDPRQVLIIGDGRTEIKAGVDLGCVTISRLAAEDTRQRELHTALGTNFLIADYTHPNLKQLIRSA